MLFLHLIGAGTAGLSKESKEFLLQLIFKCKNSIPPREEGKINWFKPLTKEA